MIEIEDEILAGEPLYTISTLNGAVIQDNVKIEMKTPKLKKGTPINKKLFKSLVPVGTIIQTDADLSTDETYLPCDGRFLQQDEYPKLYGKLGYKYGGGDAIGGYGIGEYYDSASNCAILTGLDNNDDATIIVGDFDSFVTSHGSTSSSPRDLIDNENYILRKGTNDETIDLFGGIINQYYKSYNVVDDYSVYGATIFKGLLLASVGKSGIYSLALNDSSRTWTLRVSATEGPNPYFAQNDNIVVSCVNDGTNWYIYSSTDGISWTKRLTYANTKFYSYVDVKHKNGVFLARIYDKIYRSTNGTTWTDVTPTNLALTSSGYLIATDKYFVFLNNGINYSEDGIIWLNKVLPTGVSSLYERKVLGSLITSNGVFYDIDGGFRIPFAKGRWIKVK